MFYLSNTKFFLKYFVRSFRKNRLQNTRSFAYNYLCASFWASFWYISALFTWKVLPKSELYITLQICILDKFAVFIFCGFSLINQKFKTKKWHYKSWLIFSARVKHFHYAKQTNLYSLKFQNKISFLWSLKSLKTLNV